MIKVARIAWVILTLLFFAVVSLFGQCTTAITVESLPYSDTFCTPPEIQTQVVESNECYDCINNAGWYHFEVAEGGGLITLEVAFDLCNSNGTNCGNVNGYYWLFESCPNGELLSVPSLGCWGDVMYSCWWPWYPFNTLTCFSGIPETSAGTEFNYPPSTHYQIEFELEQGDYYFAVAPSGTCSAVAYGCIELEFSGPIILGSVQEPEAFTESEQEQNMNGVYYTPDLGVYIQREGKKYDLTGREI